jgi:hypothetical protein
MGEITYEAGVEDGLAYAINSIEKAMDNPALDILTPRQVLGILIASLKTKDE